MATTTDSGDFGALSYGEGSPVASSGERLRAFRRARRHTLYVRTLKLALPAVAVVAVTTYVALVMVVVGVQPKNFDPGTVRINSENLVMENPRYDGFGKDGVRYQMRAKNAVTDLKISGPVRLNEIDGDLVQQTGTVTKLTATWGTFDQKKNELELYEKIDIDGSTGLKARLTRATVYTKDNRVVSNEPVVVEMPTGTVRGRAMVLNSSTRQVNFSGGVDVRLKANAPSGAAERAAQETRRTTSAPFSAVALNSSEPIDVRSQTLDVDDNAKTALFRHDVIAKQGSATLTAPELQAVYEGQADGLAKEAAGPAATTRLKLLKARGGVAMMQKEDRATGNTLDYDAALETALLTGDVVVYQGKNVIKGQRLFIDQKAGKTRLESPAQDGQPSGRIAATFHRNEPRTAVGGAAGKGGIKGEPKAEASPAAASLLPLDAAFKTDPTAPIDIDADMLDVFEQRKVAVFKGSVRAKQGEFVVRCAEMTAHYTSQNGAAQAGNKPAEGSQLTKIEARQKVLITSADGRTASGDWADFDVKSNTAVVGGSKVVVSQGQSVVEGTKLLIDMNTGQSRFEIADGQGAGAKSVEAPANCPEGQVCKGRIRAVFYPKEVEAAKKPPGPERRSGAEDKSNGGARRQQETSSWPSTTRSPGAE